MRQRPDIDKKVDTTLSSLDGIRRATPQPWLYARVKGRLQREEKTPWETISSFLSKPAVAMAGLCVILILNVALLLGKGEDTTALPMAQTDQQTLVDSESIIASNSSFDYENLMQP